MIAGAPGDVKNAAGRLACTTVVLVNVGIDRPDVSDASWSYFYDGEYVFSRISFPHRMAASVVPPGTSSIQAEIYFSNKYKPLEKPATDYIAPVIDGLRWCGLIQEQDKILFRDVMVIPYANVIFDQDRSEALKAVHGYLDDVGIGYCGRYGEWGHHWTDEALISGENAAQRMLDHMTSSCLGSA
jgi:protoporphyrinogen oxidase